MYRGQLRWQTVAILLVLAMTWGANMAFIKFAARDVAPLFMAGLRSAVAAGVIFLYMRWQGIPVFPSALTTGHGAVVGLLFAAEFGLIYLGLQVTLASRTYLLVYTAPFFVALGAHFFLEGDRLNWGKGIGLGVAFSGVALLFAGNLKTGSGAMLKGDLMALAGGALWAATSLYVKRYLTGRTRPLQAVFFQLFFSAPLLLGLSFIVEDPLISGFSVLTGISLFYQCIVVASVSFIFWFELVHRYPVSLLHAFTFFVPVFGISVSGVLMLHEVITARLMLALGMVGLGMVLVNHGSVKSIPIPARKSPPPR
ncbi:MAG: DMT family transporter [Desulfobacterales bacterium]